MSTENKVREDIARLSKSLFDRGFSVGSAGNISAAVDDGILMTPTNCCLGFLDPASISKVSRDGRHISGDKPSKEIFLHNAFYETRPQTGAVVHLHSTYATALSCLTDVDPDDCISPLTPYVVMRVGQVKLVPYVRPGDEKAGDLIRDLGGRQAARPAARCAEAHALRRRCGRAEGRLRRLLKGRTMKTADLVDAHGEEVQFCDLPFLKLGRRKAFCGPIATVKCFEDNALLKAELQTPGEGRIMVVDGGASSRVALLGDQIATILAENGWAGIVINGAVRDSAEIDAMDVGVFCLSVTPKKSVKDGAGKAGGSIQFGGVTFAPGGYLYADADGVLVSAGDLRQRAE